VAGDALSYDIYSQAAQALRSTTGVRPLGKLSLRFVLAIGESQSAARLAAYINGVHPQHEVVDALILHSSGAAVRADLKIPAWKVLNETDVFSQFFAASPTTFVRWAEQGIQPPIAPRIQLTDTTPLQIVRDSQGNALGGIRLSQLAVPTAWTTGQNSGASFCGLRGTHEPFSDAVLAWLYPSHEDYVGRVRQATEAVVAAGYILPVDGKETVEAAKASIVGKGLVCGKLCQNVGGDMTSISKLRDQTATLDYGGTHGKQLVRLLETALEEVASGDTAAVSHRPTAAKYYDRAIQDLTKYIREVRQFKQNGTIPAWTADWLVSSAQALSDKVAALK
jgi:hypothetical protein